MTNEITIRAKAFSGDSIKPHKVQVDMTSGIIRVWDSIAGHFTSCHSLSVSAISRIYKAVNYTHKIGA